MKITREIKVQVVIGIFVYFLIWLLKNPIYSLLSKIFLSVFSKVHISTISYIFRAAAVGEPYDFSIFGFTLLFSLGLGAGLFFFISPKLIKFLEKKEEKAGKSERLNRKMDRALKIVKGSAFMCYLIMSVFLLFVFWQQVFIARTITSFKQHMAIIGPYISEIEKTDILSQWAQMNDEAAYKEIYKKISAVASENKLKLPKNPIY